MIFTGCQFEKVYFQALLDHLQVSPSNLQELCVPVTASTSRRHLRSAAHGDQQVLAWHTSGFGPRGFVACTPKLCSSLPPFRRDPTLTLTLFCSRLMTHLFGLTYGGALVTADRLWERRVKYCHTYIHVHTYIHRPAVHFYVNDCRIQQ